MYSVFRPTEIFQSSDVVMMTNGAGRHDSYLATLSRLSGAKAVVDLGPLGPTELLIRQGQLPHFCLKATL